MVQGLWGGGGGGVGVTFLMSRVRSCNGAKQQISLGIAEAAS